MAEYRENTTEAETERVIPEDLQPGFMSLAAQYGLGDEMEIGGSPHDQVTIEQEYSTYIAAALSPALVDIIKFWEVSLWIFGVSYCGIRMSF